MRALFAAAIALTAVSGCATTDMISSERVVVPMNMVAADGTSHSAGMVTLNDSIAGLVLLPALVHIPEGSHGFHVHANGSCAPGPDAQGKTIAAGAAGGHFDPQNTGMHGPPQGPGHMGDLPPITADSVGNVADAVVAPRLKLADVRGKALMVHVGGDNHSDHPAPLGGGGGRMACGVIPQ